MPNETSKKISELINLYVERFDRNFPIFLAPASSDEELIEILEECLRTGTPYEVEYDPSMGVF